MTALRAISTRVRPLGGRPGRVGGALGLGALLALSGCAGSLGLGGSNGLFGGDGAVSAQPGLAQGGPLTAAVQPAVPVGPDYFMVHGKCPEVVVDPDDQALTVFQPGTTEGAGNVRYQATIDDTARECNTLQPGTLTLRIGIAGRVVSGPKPVAGTVNVPIRVAVIDDTDTVVKTAWQTVAVALAGPDYASDYSKVAEISVPAPEESVTLRIQAALDPNPPKPAPARVAAPRPAGTAPRQAPAGARPPAGNAADSRAPAVFRWPG